MTTGLICISPPVEEPVTLGEAKLHLRIDDLSPTVNPEDSLIMGLIVAARRWCEGIQNRAYVTQVWDMLLDGFPAEGYIEIPKPPLQSILSLSYKDNAGSLQVVSFMDPSGTQLFETNDYFVDFTRQPGRLYLKNGKSWPNTLGEAQVIEIQFSAGYGTAADVPQEIKAAMLLKISDLYENRGDAPVGERFEAAAKSLLWLDRIIPI